MTLSQTGGAILSQAAGATLSQTAGATFSQAKGATLSHTAGLTASQTFTALTHGLTGSQALQACTRLLLPKRKPNKPPEANACEPVKTTSETTNAGNNIFRVIVISPIRPRVSTTSDATQHTQHRGTFHDTQQDAVPGANRNPLHTLQSAFRRIEINAKQTHRDYFFKSPPDAMEKTEKKLPSVLCIEQMREGDAQKVGESEKAE